MEIENKVIIVTGASSGIGLHTATYLASKGAIVVLAARTAEKLYELEATLPKSLAIPTDVTKPEEANRLVDQTIAKFGHIDVLINDAAQTMFSRVENIEIEQYRVLLELNLIAPLRLMQLVIPHMRKQGRGTIINISSLSTTKFIPNIAGYASSKYALNCLSLTAREELAADNIKVSIIRPGIADTDFGKHTPNPEPDTLRHALDGSLMPYVISPDKIATKIGELIKSGEADLQILEE